MRRLLGFRPFAAIGAWFVVCLGEPAALAQELRQEEVQANPPNGKRLLLTLSGTIAPSWSNPTLSDGHPIPEGSGPGWSLRLEGRFQVLPRLGLGLGGDYLATSSSRGPTESPVAHLGFPILVAFTPLRTPRFELGAALGIGPAWAWYENTGYEVDGSTLRSSGVIYELRAEGGFPLTPMFSIQTSVGFRFYAENFSNGNAYAEHLDMPASALDVGIGARLHL